MKILLDSAVILASFAVIWTIERLSLSELTVPILGLMVALYILSSLGSGIMKNHKKATAYHHEILHSFLLTIIVLLLVDSTGRLSSPFYFLFYFLPFALSFLLHPVSSLVFALCVCFSFFPELLATDYIKGMVQIGSFIAVAPLAFFFGSEYREHLRLSQATDRTVSGIVKDIGKIIEDENKVLTKTETDALTDILNQVQDLKRKNRS